MKTELKLLKKKLSEGCGEEYIDEEMDFEFMCGKHIWKDKNDIFKLRLCENCKDKYDYLKEIFGGLAE